MIFEPERLFSWIYARMCYEVWPFLSYCRSYQSLPLYHQHLQYFAHIMLTHFAFACLESDPLNNNNNNKIGVQWLSIGVNAMAGQWSSIVFSQRTQNFQCSSCSTYHVTSNSLTCLRHHVTTSRVHVNEAWRGKPLFAWVSKRFDDSKQPETG